MSTALVIVKEFIRSRCRKLPKGMKDWQAFLDLRRKIDDFNETCPLLEMMSNKAMAERHWQRISNLTKSQFDIESENFTLGKPFLLQTTDFACQLY